MGILHRVVPDLGLTVVLWYDAITDEESVEHLVRLAADPEWRPGLPHLTDMRTVTSVTLPDPELVELLFEGSHWRDEDFVQVVVVSPALLQTTTVQDNAASLGMNAKPFGDIAAACARLEVDPIRVSATLAELRSESRAHD